MCEKIRDDVQQEIKEVEKKKRKIDLHGNNIFFLFISPGKSSDNVISASRCSLVTGQRSEYNLIV